MKHSILILGGAMIAASSFACLDAIDPLDPKVGEPTAARCANEDSDPDVDVSFQDNILPMLTGASGPIGCGCHQPTDPNPIGLELAGLDLSSFSGVRAGGNNSLGSIVVPGQPCSSVLWQKVSPGPPFGSRMPFDGPPFLSPMARQMISDWIAEGARDN